MAEAKTVKKAPKKAPVAEKASEPKVVAKKAPKADKSLFAVIATGGKQYRVSVGENLKIEKLLGEHKEGDKVTFDHVLLVDNGASEVTLGKPFISGSTVTGTIKKISRYKTVDVIKYKQKSRYFKKYGHRQPYFEVTIDSIK